MKEIHIIFDWKVDKPHETWMNTSSKGMSNILWRKYMWKHKPSCYMAITLMQYPVKSMAMNNRCRCTTCVMSCASLWKIATNTSIFAITWPRREHSDRGVHQDWWGEGGHSNQVTWLRPVPGTAWQSWAHGHQASSTTLRGRLLSQPCIRLHACSNNGNSFLGMQGPSSFVVIS